jgi:hypothetical protein
MSAWACGEAQDRRVQGPRNDRQIVAKAAAPGQQREVLEPSERLANARARLFLGHLHGAGLRQIGNRR